MGRAAQQGGGPGPQSGSDLDEIRKVSALLDTDVMNRTNETIAGIEDLVLSHEGAIRYVILSHGGLAGVGAKYLAVPWEDLDVKHENGKWAINLNMTKDALGNAPTLQSQNYSELTNSDWVARDRDFFRSRTATQGQATQEPGVEATQTVPMVLIVSKITKATLKNTQNEDVGAVEDLLLDRNYHAAYAIVGRGGVLGVGESYIPVPWSKLRLSNNREDNSVTAVIDATKQQLEQAPLVQGNSYSTLLAPGFAGQVDRYFSSMHSDSNTPRQGDNASGTVRP